MKQSTADTFPQLMAAATGIATPVHGRVFTIGSSPECRLQLPGRSLPAVVAHLIFKEGAWSLQVLTKGMPVTVNGKAAEVPVSLGHGDRLRFGVEEYVFAEKRLAGSREMPAARPDAGTVKGGALHELIGAVVALLRTSDEAVFTDLVACISRILRCDAARLVEEAAGTGERKTIARYPAQSGLDRFSNRAIDWARDAARTVIMHDAEWQSPEDSANSLEKNMVASVLCAPLREGDAMLGYLYLDRLQGNRPFTEDDRSFLDALLPLFSEILANYHERRRQRETIARLQEQQIAPSGGMLFESDGMKNVVQLAIKAAPTETAVLILGETGTGKELMARLIHNNSARSDKPFRVLNCGALPDQLIESELFGHEKGAFTGATNRKAGMFEAADTGTLLLDEIGEMPQHLQVKLLRVLQEGEFTRVGGTETVRVNVRIMAATNKKLDREVAEGRFRQDLYYRLNVMTLELPPLRERGGDISLLAEYFIKKYCLQFGLPLKTLSSAARNKLASYAWPGNIRELENTIQRAILLSQDNRINEAEIIAGPADAALAVSGNAGIGTLHDARERAERAAIDNALLKSGGNVSLASKMLVIDRKWLIKKMESLGIDADKYRK